MIIPHRELSEEALCGLVEEFVTREGTDYGGEIVAIEEKVAAVLRQLDSGKVVVVFDPDDQSCNLMPADALPTKEHR